MPVELPDDLAVADRRDIERIEQGPVPEGSLTLRHGIEMPVDRVTEGQIPVAQ